VSSAGFAACSIFTPFDDLSRDFAADAGGVEAALPDDAGEVADALGVSDAPIDAARACRVVMAPEGKYTYASQLGGIFNGADSLSVSDAAIPTQPWDNPFFATVRHDGDAGARDPCFTFTAFYAQGDAGSHEHSWTFCNRCIGDAGALDIVSEVDVIKIGTILQTTNYVCATPNVFFQDGVLADASLPQGSCTGQTAGATSLAVQVNPVSNFALGPGTDSYAGGFDGSYPTATSRFDQEVVVSGAGKSTPAIQVWGFNAETGLPTFGVGLRTLNLDIQGTPVVFSWFNVFKLYSPDVAPLPK
jgi:hypothetical protein